MKWRACAVTATPCHGPLQCLLGAIDDLDSAKAKSTLEHSRVFERTWVVVRIDVSEQTFKRLQRHAVPLKDTPEDVIMKLIDAYEGKKSRTATKTISLDEFLPEEMRTKRRVTGFANELWELVITKLPKEFLLADVYRHMDTIRRKRPHVRELEASARAALQTLRDAGYIEFLDNRGQYRKVEVRA